MSEILYKRIPNSEVLDIYKSDFSTGEYHLVILLKNKPEVKIKSKLLTTTINQREDRNWALIISLKEGKYLDVFNSLIEDLVQSIVGETKQDLAEIKIIDRYVRWQELFDVEVKKRVSNQVLVGLIGELFVFKVLLGNYPASQVVSAWMGPDKASKDFQFSDSWFEVKTKSIKKETVTIHGQSQLTSTVLGYLVVVDVERVSPQTSGANSVRSLYEDIVRTIKDSEQRLIFEKKLAIFGSIKDEMYDDFCVGITNISFYKIDSSFPKLVEEPFQHAFTNITYDINLSSIQNYKVEGNLHETI